jgi:alkanesulfonate monooxygenase SsuD/methylene tetrahydromethanopterin reductase-like flavin-dependent oxidoreductase (luciferase family)
MLDEGLDLIDCLWSGRAVSYSGKHYTVQDAQLTARPVQEPRVPIWVGGNLLVRAVRRRILRWDGSCAYKGGPGAPQRMTPEDVRDLRRDGAVDVKVSGGDPAAFAQAGATWWGRWIPPLPVDETVAVIRSGPPKI